MILTIRDEPDPALLDLIGPVFGTLPVTARQQASVMLAIEERLNA
jgi:hypothetical protein